MKIEGPTGLVFFFNTLNIMCSILGPGICGAYNPTALHLLSNDGPLAKLTTPEVFKFKCMYMM